MIGRLTPYPTYKDSGVTWLGEVPRGWEVRRLKHAFDRILGGATPASGTEEYWGGDIVWATPTDVSQTDLLLASERTLTAEGLEACSAGIVPAGSIIATSRAPVGNLAIAGVPLCTNQGCKALVPNPDRLQPGCAFLTLRVMAAEMRSWAVGTTFPEISTGRMGSLGMPFPPARDQAAIVCYLDHVDARIQRFIAAKERLIELLEEEKQAIIHRAVTRGLDPGVKLKPSGIDWLGEVPAHWQPTSLRRITESRCDGPFGSGLTSAHYVDQGVRVVRLQNISSGSFVEASPAFVSREHYASLGDHDVYAGDVLVAGLGDDRRCVGRACVAPDGIEPAMVKADCFRFRLKEDPSPAFVAEQLSSTAPLVAGSARGATRQRMNLGAIAARPLLLPPADEQLEINGHICATKTRLSRATAGATRQISLLDEFRTRMISDVVTGKLDVREAAAKLPADPDADDATLDAQLEEAIA